MKADIYAYRQKNTENGVGVIHSSTDHRRLLASTHCTYPRRDSQAKLTWVVG